MARLTAAWEVRFSAGLQGVFYEVEDSASDKAVGGRVVVERFGVSSRTSWERRRAAGQLSKLQMGVDGCQGTSAKALKKAFCWRSWAEWHRTAQLNSD